MSQAFRLPPELRAFIELPGPQSLLIRGPPGAGKTTLSLAILEAFRGPRFYVTGRVPGVELALDYPWLGTTEAARIEIVDAGSTAPTESDGAAPEAGREGHRPKEPVGNFAGLPPALLEAWNRGEADPEGSKGLWWLPRRLRGPWKKVGSGEPAMVVVDSWDAFVDEYSDGAIAAGAPPPDRGQLERILLRQVRRGISHFILVLEREEQSQLDYLVNGIVNLTRITFEDNMERWLTLPKLRGLRIEFGSYPFTMEGARFQCISPIPGNYRVDRVSAEPDPRREPGQLWPGSSDFATAFGRMAAGAVTVVEVEPGVPDSSLQSLVFPPIVHAIRQWAQVAMAPPPSFLFDEIWNPLRASIPEDQLASQLRIIPAGRMVPLDHPMHAISVSPSGDPSHLSTSLRIPKVAEFLSQRNDKDIPNLVLTSADALRALARVSGFSFTSDNPPMLLPSGAGTAPLHSIFLASSGDPMIDMVRNLAALHLRLKDRRGRTFIYGVRPRTPGYVMTLHTDRKPYELLKIV